MNSSPNKISSGRQCWSIMSRNRILKFRTSFKQLTGTSIWIFAGLYFLVFSYQIRVPLTLSKFDPGPALLPKIMGALLLCGGLYTIAKAFIVKERKQQNVSGHCSKLLATAVFAYLLVLPVLGFHIATVIFGMFSMLIMRVKLYIALICTAAIVTLIHFIFITLFAIPLPGFSGF